MSLRGDFRRLDQLSASLRRASVRARKDTLSLFAVDVGTQVALCFSTSRSPYGEVWAPLKRPGRRRRGGQPLLDSGRLRNSIRSKPTALGLQVSSNVVYAAIQNYGGTIARRGGLVARSERSNRFVSKSLRATRQAGNQEFESRAIAVSFFGAHQLAIPRRQFLPDVQRGLPERWKHLLRVAADQVQGQLRLGGL